jgi:hypothetical protein
MVKIKIFITLIMFVLVNITIGFTQELKFSFKTKFVTELDEEEGIETLRHRTQEFHFDYDNKTLLHVLGVEKYEQVYLITDVIIKEIEEGCLVIITEVTSQQGSYLRYIFHVLMCEDDTQSLAQVLPSYYLIYHN